MPAGKEFQEKVDVLDILISILRDHEESLQKIAERFDAVSNEVQGFEEKAAVLDRALEHLGGNKMRTIIGATGTKGPLVTVNCKSWQSFKGASQGALLVAYEVAGEQANFSSVSDLSVFTFSGELGETSLQMSRGARRWIEKALGTEENGEAESGEGVSADGESAYKTVVNSETVKRWLSSETAVPEDRIVEGRVIN
jgi:hypothetical protein